MLRERDHVISQAKPEIVMEDGDRESEEPAGSRRGQQWPILSRADGWRHDFPGFKCEACSTLPHRESRDAIQRRLANSEQGDSRFVPVHDSGAACSPNSVNSHRDLSPIIFHHWEIDASALVPRVVLVA